MSTSVSDLKQQLRDFLSDPSKESEFRVWFARELRNAHKSNDMELESLLHTVQRAFSDAAEGLYAPEELVQFLTELSAPVVPSQLVPFYFSGSNSQELQWKDKVPSSPDIMLVSCP